MYLVASACAAWITDCIGRCLAHLYVPVYSDDYYSVEK